MLTKSYLDKTDCSRSPPQDRVLYDLFKRVYKQGRITEFVNLQTGERVDNGYILQQSDKYAKGLLSLDVQEPGVDCILMVGCYSLEALAVWVAGLSMGVSVLADIIFMPRTASIEGYVNTFKPKIVVAGDAADEEIVEALLSLYQSGTPLTVSDKLSSVKHVYYEGKNMNHFMNYPFMKPLDGLIQQGQTIGEAQLERAREKVQPEHISQTSCSTGTTGGVKHILHTHRSFLERIGTPVLTKNGSVCIADSLNRGSMVAFTRSALNLSGKTDKLVFSPDISKNSTKEAVAKICADSIIEECVNLVVILPKELDSLCDYMAKSYPRSKQIKYTVLLGQSYTKKHKQKIKDSLGGLIVTLYGMTEIPTVGVTPFGASESDKKDRMEAKLILTKGSVMRVVDDNDCIVDIETEGRIQLKSTCRFKEYLQAKENKVAFTEDGFYKTKDVGIMYPDGKFVIIGRESVRTSIPIRRVKIWPSMIEEVIATHQNIRDVKVISSSLSTDTDGEIVYCICMERGIPNLRIQEVINHCVEKQMFELEYPRRVLFFDEFPPSENGRKTDFNMLREIVLQRIDENPDIGYVPGSYTQ